MIAAAGNINAKGGSSLHKALRRSGNNPSVALQCDYLPVSDIDPGMLCHPEGKITVDHLAGDRLDKDLFRLKDQSELRRRWHWNRRHRISRKRSRAIVM